MYIHAFPNEAWYKRPEKRNYCVYPIYHDNALSSGDGLDDAFGHLAGIELKRIILIAIEQMCLYKAGTNVGETYIKTLHSGKLGKALKICVLKSL